MEGDISIFPGWEALLVLIGLLVAIGFVVFCIGKDEEEEKEEGNGSHPISE